MIYTESDYVTRRTEGAPFTGDDAQTVASWWYSTGAPALVIFAQQGRIVAGLREEIQFEIDNARFTTAADREDLAALLRYVEGQGVDPA
jgi:hypothetical protein